MVQGLTTLRMTAFAALLLVGTARAYDPSAKNNVALYWGQHTTEPLSHFCQNDAVDVVILSFMNHFPGQSASETPGTNFAGNCNNGFFPGTELHRPCAPITEGIKTCQTLGKKVLLALGGESGYQLSGAAEGKRFADWLWAAYGPQSANNGELRPFESLEIDGFDFDIELPSPDKPAGYIAMIHKLRSHYATGPKEYFITGAPQCVVPDANMGEMISKAHFDMLFVQFYNTHQCSARAFVDSGEGFTYDTLLGSLAGTPSSNAKVYLGLPGDESGANPGFYLTDGEVEKLIQGNANKANFGGAMIWDAQFAHDNTRHGGRPYYQVVKGALNKYAGSSVAAPIRQVIWPTPVTLVKDTTAVVSSEKNSPLSSLSEDVQVDEIDEPAEVIQACPTTSCTSTAESTALAQETDWFVATGFDEPSAAAMMAASTPLPLAMVEVDGVVADKAEPIAAVYFSQFNMSWPAFKNITIPSNNTLNTSNVSTTLVNKATGMNRPVVAAMALGALALGFIAYA